MGGGQISFLSPEEAAMVNSAGGTGLNVSISLLLSRSCSPPLLSTDRRAPLQETLYTSLEERQV